MISLDSEPNPFRSFSYSLTMDGGRGGGGGRGGDEDDASCPSWVHSIDDEQNSTTSNNTSTRHEFKKSSLRSRWLILALTCVVMTGSYYA